jgi:hypothetical protein
METIAMAFRFRVAVSLLPHVVVPQSVVLLTTEHIQQHHDLWSADWWKRGEGPPEFTCDRNPPEWWQKGDEPPEYDCAA